MWEACQPLVSFRVVCCANCTVLEALIALQSGMSATRALQVSDRCLRLHAVVCGVIPHTVVTPAVVVLLFSSVSGLATVIAESVVLGVLLIGKAH